MTAAVRGLPASEDTRLPGDRRYLARVMLAVLAVLTVLVAFASVALGPISLGADVVWQAILQEIRAAQPLSADQARARVILFDIRLPRTVMGLLVGGALAVAGAIMQGLFRNPLADPGLVGVSAGASLAAVTVIVLGASLLTPVFGEVPLLALPIAAFLGALIGTVALYRIATHRGRTSTATMLLAGIAIAALTQSAIGVLVFISDDQQLRDLTFWSLGSLGGATWEKAAMAALFIIPVLMFSPILGRGLNGLLLGEAEALHVGIDIQRLKRVAIVVAAFAVGVSVAISGRHRVCRHRRAPPVALDNGTGQHLSAAGMRAAGRRLVARRGHLCAHCGDAGPNCRSGSSPR